MNPIKKFREMDSILKWFTALAFFAVSATIFSMVIFVREYSDSVAFEEKCEVACYPNTVFSTQKRKCICNATVVYKEVK